MKRVLLIGGVTRNAAMLAALREKLPATEFVVCPESPWLEAWGSALLARVARVRCPWARVQRADMWAESWRDFDLVYLFQRPESMERAWRKACAEMTAGAWFVSLEFEVPGIEPHALLQHAGERAVRVYRLGGPAAAVATQPQRAGADKPPSNAHARAPA